jgi:hypothetical protein
VVSPRPMGWVVLRLGALRQNDAVARNRLPLTTSRLCDTHAVLDRLVDDEVI